MSQSRDSYYTPSDTARDLLQGLKATGALRVVDPAAGHGSLLQAVRARLPESLTYGIDADRLAVRQLALSSSVDMASCANFLEPNSLAASRVGRELREIGPDFVVMNPPFSYRGQGGVRVLFDNEIHRLSPAAVFVAKALSLWNPPLGLRAVMPMGVMRSERHAAFWSSLAKNYTLLEMGELPSSTFKGARVRSLVIEFLPRVSASPAAPDRIKVPTPSDEGQLLRCVCVDVIRGRVSRHQVPHEGAERPYLHTSELRSDDPVRATTRTAAARLASAGRMILLPRVGNPSSFRPVSVEGPIVLSDCLLAVRPLFENGESDLLARMSSNWADLARMFSGTGAPYLTVGRLSDFLSDLGYHPRFVEASSVPEPASCSCSYGTERDTSMVIHERLSA